MKFITEEDLRDLYRKEPFTDFDLEPGARLTPGARQFLMDKGINMLDADSCSTGKKQDVKPEAPSASKKDACNDVNLVNNANIVCMANGIRIKKLINRMKSIEALFFLTEEELLSRDVCLAQKVINLGKQLTCIKNAVENKAKVENLICSECTGFHADNFSKDMDDCFEITEFHIQLEKGREIILLHRLRCELNELKLVVFELYEGSDEENGCEDIIGKLNQIINSLSQLICFAFGGKKCQRQN